MGAGVRGDGEDAGAAGPARRAARRHADHRGPGRRHRAAVGVRAAARGRGPVRRFEIQSEYERDRTAAGERHAATARAARPTESAKAEAWESVVESDKLPNAVQEAVIAGFVQTDQRELLAPYTERYFEALKGAWESRSLRDGPADRGRPVPGGAGVPGDPGPHGRLAVLGRAERGPAPAGLESRSGVERALRAQAADAAAAE
ncbi:ERAP1-like C-terminal domain-containing protein [Streptomyces thinghirensis]|nr:ERAP1-like C-terminal domain-containing protein [Streptomyces thinghirensis]